MRILLVSDVYFPRVNGVSTAIETHRRGLARLGIEVTLIAPRYDDETDQEGIIRLPGWKIPGDPEDRIVVPHTMRRAVREAAAKADLIHIQTPFSAHYAGIAAARERKIPVIATYHTLFEEYLHLYARHLPEAWLRAFARRISRSQCNALDATIVPSKAMEQRLREYRIASPLHVLPTGIPLEQFAIGERGAHRARFRSRYRIPPEQPVALFVGRVAHEKNLRFLIDSLAHARQTTPDLLLVIAGEGPAQTDLQDYVTQRGQQDHVRFLGYLDREHELPDCYAAADLFAFASTTETQGLVLLEAMAVGLPVVALAEMGTRDLLEKGRGAIVPRFEVADFGAALASLVADPRRRADLGAQAKALARSWSDEDLTERLADLYRLEIAQKTEPKPIWKAHSREKQA
jgi:glycosyltransferase involved in cell wall biosynthesis